MSLLELKGSILESVSQIDDEAKLKALQSLVREIVDENVPPETLQADFATALEELEDESSWVTHEEVMSRNQAKLRS